MKLTSFNIDGKTIRTKKEKINFLLEKGILKKSWNSDFIDEDTGEVVTITQKLVQTDFSHPQLNKLIVRNFINKKK